MHIFTVKIAIFNHPKISKYKKSIASTYHTRTTFLVLKNLPKYVYQGIRYIHYIQYLYSKHTHG